MAAKKTTKKKTYKKKPARRKTTKRKRKTKIKNFQQFKKVFFEKLGVISFVILIFLFLGFLFIYQLQRTEENVNDTPSVSSNYETRKKFVEAIAPVAQRLQRQYGIFASVSMAQAMLESEFGQSLLSDKYYNLFGVKTDDSDPDGVDLMTAEYVNDKWIDVKQRFKVYQSWGASMEAHAQLLVNGTSWDENFYAAVKNGKTPEEQAKGLQSAGYATDPDYAQKLINMMNEWNLKQYDQPDATQESQTSETTTD
ncbi:glycoside hydrolase family 73 protein [Aerococcaceae bacterium zg-BR22]|nr:glycoside hydrolase family 73 protein [Aerococcaceae bacterium zg-BR22]